MFFRLDSQLYRVCIVFSVLSLDGKLCSGLGMSVSLHPCGWDLKFQAVVLGFPSHLKFFNFVVHTWAVVCWNMTFEVISCN